jgi:hypothetical protein
MLFTFFGINFSPSGKMFSHSDEPKWCEENKFQMKMGKVFQRWSHIEIIVNIQRHVRLVGRNFDANEKFSLSFPAKEEMRKTIFRLCLISIWIHTNSSESITLAFHFLRLNLWNNWILSSMHSIYYSNEKFIMNSLWCRIIILCYGSCLLIQRHRN